MLVDASRRHARVTRLDDDCNALRLQRFVERARNLAGQPFLELKPPRECIDEPLLSMASYASNP